VPKTISVQVDEETFIKVNHALQNAIDQTGMTISKSLFLRRLLAKALEDPTPLIDQGYVEGYRAAFAAALRTISASLRGIADDPSQIPGLQGLGMSSPYDDRGQGGF
jgi:hypothetical protein